MIYLDNAATTKPYTEVVETITDVLNNSWGNANSPHGFGHKSKEIVEAVRDQIASDINCKPEEIIFTSSGCEANTMAINSIPEEYELFTTKLEHSSILNAASKMCNVHFIHNDEFGNITTDALIKILKRNQIYSSAKPFVSICGANSEIGVIQNIKALGEIIHKHEGIFHCDATALYPHHQIDVKELEIDMMTVSAQKFHATEGVGFLYVRNGVNVKPLIYGNQENGLRGGSYNTALIAGMGKALEITRSQMGCKHLRDFLLEGLLKIPRTSLNGPAVDANRLDSNISLTIEDVDSETLLSICDIYGICISKGSACHSYNKEPSPTLKAIGLTNEQAMQTIRISIDSTNTHDDIEKALSVFPGLIEAIRKTY